MNLYETCRKLTWEERIEAAKAHERYVMEKLKSLGWHAEWWGQTLFSDQLREVLKEIKSPIRWQPDIITTNRKLTVFVDAKCSMSPYPNWSIEKDSLECHRLIERSLNHKVWYWTPDDTIADIELIDTYKVQGPPNSRGSRKDYWLIPKNRYLPYTDVFNDTSNKEIA